MQVWDVVGGQCVATLTGHNKPVQSLWIKDGRLYSTAGRYLRVWDVDAPSFPCVRVLQLPRNGGAISALALDDAGILYVAGQVQQYIDCTCSALPCCDTCCSHHGSWQLCCLS